MKKRTTSKNSQAKAAVDQDVVGLITTLVQRLVSLEAKIDTVLSRQPVPALSVKQRTDTRIMYKAICADCNKECEVPFRPSGDRPVYCKGCFAARKNKAAGQAPAHIRPPEKPQAAAPAPATKPAAKKKSAAKKKKK